LEIQVQAITPAVKYLKVVIPAEAGIQKNTGCRIKSGMTEFGYLLAGLICSFEHLVFGFVSYFDIRI